MLRRALVSARACFWYAGFRLGGGVVHMCWMERIDDKQMDIVRARFETLSPHLDEKGRRLLAAFEARSVGYGGTSRVSEVTGMVRSTIGRGLKELDGSVALAVDGRVRREGAGRKRATETQPDLMPALRALVEQATMDALNIWHEPFHGEWNYTFMPLAKDEALN